jgi:hypothetical protein
VPLDLEEKDRWKLCLQLAEQLAGLNMLEVDWTLNEVRRLIFMTSFAGADTAALQRQIDGFNAKYGDRYQPAKRQ